MAPALSPSAAGDGLRGVHHAPAAECHQRPAPHAVAHCGCAVGHRPGGHVQHLGRPLDQRGRSRPQATLGGEQRIAVETLRGDQPGRVVEHAVAEGDQPFAVAEA